MSELRKTIGFVLILGLVIVIIDRWPDKSAPPPPITGNVNRVVDGDSLYITAQKTQIRLFGVDAPERNEQGYHAAKSTLRRLLLNEAISCNQVDIDRYERIIARCYLADGREVNQLMIESGTTQEYCRFSKGLYGRC